MLGQPAAEQVTYDVVSPIGLCYVIIEDLPHSSVKVAKGDHELCGRVFQVDAGIVCSSGCAGQPAVEHDSAV